jgi:hypothetical protein
VIDHNEAIGKAALLLTEFFSAAEGAHMRTGAQSGERTTAASEYDIYELTQIGDGPHQSL